MTVTTTIQSQRFELGAVTVNAGQTHVNLPAAHVPPAVHAAALEVQRIVAERQRLWRERDNAETVRRQAREQVTRGAMAAMLADRPTDPQDVARQLTDADTAVTTSQVMLEGALAAEHKAYAALKATVREYATEWQAYLNERGEAASERLAAAHAELVAAYRDAATVDGLDGLAYHGPAERAVGPITPLTFHLDALERAASAAIGTAHARLAGQRAERSEDDDQ